MARLKADLVLGLTDNVSANARRVENSIDRLQRKQGGAMGLMRQQNAMTTESMVGMGASSRMALAGAASYMAPLAAGLGVREVVTQAADFEKALTGIQKKAGTTAAETAALGEEIKALATSGKLATSIDEVAAAYERGAAAGIPIDELKQFAFVSAKAADAFEMSSTDVGNAAAGFSKILKIPMNEMEKYFDLINGLADSGISDEKDIVDFADRGGSSLKAFGLQNEQIAALGATMGNLKVPAEVAANAMKAFVGRIRAPGKMDKRGQGWLLELTGNIDTFQKKVDKDANGAMLELLDSLNKLEGAAKVDAISAIAGGNYDDNITTLVSNLDEYRRNLNYAANETQWFGSLDKSYNLKLDDMWSKWQLLKNEMSVLAIDVGTAGMPALKASIEGIKALVADIGQGFAAFKGDLDWPEITAAQAALSEMGGKLTTLLGTDTSQSAIGVFFRDLADAVNSIASGINTIEKSAIFKVVTGDKAKTAEILKTDVNPKTGRMNKAPIKGGLLPGLTDFLAGATGSPTEEPGRIVYPDIKYNPVVPAFADAQPLPPEGDLGKSTGAETTLPRFRDAPVAVAPRESPAMSVIKQSMPAPVVVAPPPETARTAPVVSARQAEASSMQALIQQFGALLDSKGGFQPGTTGTDVTDEVGLPPIAPTVDMTAVDAAKAAAAVAGPEIRSALTVQGAVTLDTSGITAARSQVRALIGELKQVAGLVQEANDNSMRTRVDYSGLHADLSRAF